jgi:hypothetical protein
MARKHSSQFIYDGEHAHSGPLTLTADDYAVVRKLNPERYTYLPAPWLHAVTAPNKNYIRFAKRVATLARWQKREGHVAEAPYLERHQIALRHAVYSRTERGDRLVNEINPQRTKEHFGHQLLQDMVLASIEIGVKKATDLEIAFWSQLRDQGWTRQGEQQYVPDKTLNAADPHLIPLRDPARPKSELLARYRADNKPFKLKHLKSTLFVLGSEIDCGTEPLTTTHESRRHIKQKLTNVKFLFDHKLYEEHYRFPNSIVFLVFTNQTRMQSAMRLAIEVLGSQCEYIVFYCWSNWPKERSYPPPSDYIFTAAGKRIGYSDFKFSEFWK